jgi:hypothetical protein
MPHFGLMDPDKMDAYNAALLRSILHIKGGKKRLDEGKISDGVAALYDAVIHALEAKFLSSKEKLTPYINQSDDLTEEKDIFLVLKRARIIDNTISIDDLNYLDLVLEETLEGITDSFDENRFMSRFDNLMTQLGVLPLSNS